MKSKPKPFFTRARRLYRKNPNLTSSQILKKLTGNAFLITSSYVLNHPEDFGFVCQKCEIAAKIIGVDFTRKGITVIFFFLECPNCHARGFMRVRLTAPMPDKNVAIDYANRTILFYNKNALCGKRLLDVGKDNAKK